MTRLPDAIEKRNQSECGGTIEYGTATLFLFSPYVEAPAIASS